MKITINIDSVLDDIYADSALGAVMGLRDAASPPSLLTPDHRPALRRMAVQGAALICSFDGLSQYIADLAVPSADESPALTIGLTCESGRVPAVEAITFHLRAAISAATLHFVALSAADTVRADRFISLARHSASILTALLTTPRPFETKMQWG